MQLSYLFLHELWLGFKKVEEVGSFYQIDAELKSMNTEEGYLMILI